MESSPTTASASASPHVASLSASLVLVPPAAVPAIINCVLASSLLSPSDLFHSLLHSFPDLTVPPQPNHILSHASALCHLIKHPDTPPDALRLFIRRPLVPLLNVIDPSDSELLIEIVKLLCDAVSKTQSWELVGGTLVPFCLRTLGLCTAAVQNERMDVCQWSSVDSIPGTLPWPTACRILTSLLDSALSSGKEIESAESFTMNLIWDLSNLSLRLLQQSPENRSCAIHLLLPSVFCSLNALGTVPVLVHGSQNTFSRICFLKKIWKCCMSLFSLGHIERLDAYIMLSLYFSSYSTKDNGVASLDATEENFDLKAQREFWEEIRRGLVDKGASVRKQALYILKISLNHSSSSNCGSERDACCSNDSESAVFTKKDQIMSGVMTNRERWADEEAKSLGIGRVCHSGDCSSSGQERWKVFLLLYEMLEEYGTHLVEAAWTHQVSLLFQSRPVSDNLNPFTSGVYQVQMETLEGIFSWLAVLWERGFFHENPQVRCLIMQSFFNIDWDKRGNCAQKVPRNFVLGSLILGLNDVVHHRDFGVKGVYTSETIEGAKRYFSEFSRPLSLSERAVFVWSLASVARQDAFGRAGLMTLAFCIASAASPSSPHNVGEVQTSSLFAEQMESARDKFQPCSTSDLLNVLGIVIEKSKQHFNANYRLQVCEQVIKAASSLVNISDVPFDMLMHFLSTVPRELTDCAGPLRGIVQQWLTQINNRCYTFGSVNMEIYVLKNLIDFPTNFIKHELSPDVCVAFNDEDVDAWEVEAHRWARLLFLVVTEEKHLEPIFVFLLNYASSLCKQDLNREWLPLKLLIIVLSLVEEFQSVWRKFICPTKSGTHDEVGMTKILDQSSLVLPITYEKFGRPFPLILEKLVTFAELVSSIFWSTSMVKDTQLPCSVTGKLGGPSPRRLASLTTYAVLQAIISIRAVACISIWCAELKSDDCLDPSFTFLWFFSRKVIQFPKLDSETGAEICLAAYEALASVMKAFSTMFTPLVFDFIMAYNKSLFPDEEGRPLLDPLILNFLSNINDLLVTGLLARSRRAVLLNWKWRCLDSILSIPYNVVENRVHQKCAHPFFSDSTLISTFVDIVDSLENAGETSVLPMLRSVRLVLGLLCSATTSPRISSCAGVNCQMMFQLVHSSWILHLSCNKRRVAPIAALLSAVLHRSVFSDMLMHDTIDSKPGPLKWFIGKLLDEGIKSPRTIRLAALHLTGLWLLYPKTIKYYTKELKLLSLYGSVAFDEDFEAELSENPEARTEVSLLAQIPDSEFTEAFINTEMYARVSVAVLFYKLAKLADRREGQENEDSLAARHCGKLFLLELLDSAVNDKDLSKELYKKYSGVHRRKVRAWQMICVLSPYVEKDIVEEVTSKLHICLYRNNLPAVRQFLETFAIQIYLKFPTLAEEQLIPIFYDYNMRPQALSSYVFIAANVILHSSEFPVQIKHVNELLPPIIPFLTSHHHSLRGFTQLLVHYVLCKMWPTLRPTIAAAALEKKCFDDLKSYLAENIDCVRLRASMEGFLDAFDPNTSVTPAGIFNARKEGSEFECVPVPLIDQVITFLNDVRDDLRYSMAKDAMAIKNESLRVPDACKDKEDTLNVDAESIPSTTLKDLSLDFQKKITLQKHMRRPLNNDNDSFLGNIELSRLLLDMEMEDQLLNPLVQSRIQAMERIRGTQQPFILVASLLDRIPNLAGLARTCEVFRAAGLALADGTIVQDKQFQLISVTAEKWVPIIEVPVGSMKVFLKKKRQEGFSILGLEQTANSTPLDQYSFPRKTVMVLGREKEGIPVDIIHILDACVEIPQLGVIRSLNVHVSGAIALWEYTRQQRSKQT